MATCYVQLVMGPPGSGKSTYCNGMKQFLSTLGRSVAVVNLDPANDSLPYDCTVDIMELITLDDVMERLQLGPNGALIYCMEYLEKNFEWLHTKLQHIPYCHYYIIDCPGQVELYTHHNSIRNLASQLQKWGMKVSAVHLVDSHYCTDPGKFISVLLTSLACMIQIELPHINVLSKIDLLQQYDKLAFGLDYYTDVLDLSYLLEHLSDDPFFIRYKSLNQSLISLIEDYSLVSFIPLNIQDKESLLEVTRVIDKASGYIYTQNERDTLTGLMSVVDPADYQHTRNLSIREHLTTKK